MSLLSIQSHVSHVKTYEFCPILQKETLWGDPGLSFSILVAISRYHFPNLLFLLWSQFLFTASPSTQASQKHSEHVTQICNCVCRILYTHKYMYLSNLRGCYMPDAKNTFLSDPPPKKESIEKDHNSQAKEVKERRIQIGIRIALTWWTKKEGSFLKFQHCFENSGKIWNTIINLNSINKEEKH